MFNSPYQMSMRWFDGVVENRNDPLKISRVQVRVLGLHTDNLQQLPTEDLHWMQVMMPVTSASNSGVGESSSLTEGSHIVGYFRDGDSCQDGVVLGSFHGIPQQARELGKGFSDNRTNLSAKSSAGNPSNITFPTDGSGVVITDSNRLPYPITLDEPDTSKLARNENVASHHTIIAKKASQANQPSSFTIPAVNFQAQYPYNHVRETESGHTFELDDTPGNERISLFHRSGTYFEMYADGSSIYNTSKNSYNVTHGSSNTYINGSSTLEIDKGMSILVNSKNGANGLILTVGSGGNININVSAGNVNLNVTGDMHQKISGDYLLEVGGQAKITASRLDLN